MRPYWACLAAALCVLLVPGSGSATEQLWGQNPSLTQDQTLNDDLVAFGSNVLIQGRTNGDVTAAGSTVTVTGPVGGDLTAAGANVSIEGPVSDDVRAAGANVTLRSAVADNVALMGNAVAILPSARVGRDLDVAGATVTSNCGVGGNLRVAAADSRIGGEITGNVEARGGRVTLLPGAVIHGNLIARTDQAPVVPSGARVMGEVLHQPLSTSAEPQRAHPIQAWLMRWLFNFGWMLLLGSVLVAIAPAVMERVADKANHRPWVSGLVGFGAFVLTPILAILLMLTLIGIPLSLVLLAVWFTLVIAAQVYVAFEVGGWVLTRMRRHEVSPYLRMGVGALLISFLTSLPWVGWLILLVAICVGIGAALLARGDLLRAPRTRSMA